jgi:drug/metabolite transporter (DMT)-like permease
MTIAPSRALAGILFTLLGGLVFSASNATAKYLAATYPPGQTLFLRSLVVLVLLAPLLHLADLRRMWSGGQAGLHALRCLASAIEVGMYYWALRWLGLAEISVIYLAGPIYITAMSAVFLGERVGWRRWVAVLVGFAGVLMALRPDRSVVTLPALIAVAGSILYAISLVATRRLRDTPNAMLVASQVFTLLIPTAIPLGWVAPGLFDAAMFALVGVVAMTGYVCINRGLQLAQASVAAPFGYLSIVWASGLGFVLFHEIPTPNTLTGAAMIVGAGLFILLRERSLTPAPAPAQAGLSSRGDP